MWKDAKGNKDKDKRKFIQTSTTTFVQVRDGRNDGEQSNARHEDNLNKVKKVMVYNTPTQNTLV